MAFVQMIEFRTDNIDEIRRLENEWAAQGTGDTTARRGILCADRDQPGRYLEIVFFDSHESAMKNSELPVTAEFAEKLAAACTAPATFVNLDVVEDRDY